MPNIERLKKYINVPKLSNIKKKPTEVDKISKEIRLIQGTMNKELEIDMLSQQQSNHIHIMI